MDFDEIINQLEEKYKKIYISRLSPEVVKDVFVEAYGTTSKLLELSLITIPQPRTLLIKPYDSNLIEDILKALNKQKPEFSPVIQSDCIKVMVNPPTEETRKKAVKQAKDMLEQSKISVRQLRKVMVDEIKKEESSEDLKKREINKVDEEVKKINMKLEEIFSSKEREIMTI